MTVDDLTAVLLSNQKINIRTSQYETLYTGINDKLDDVKHKDILNKEVYYIEPLFDPTTCKVIVYITIEDGD